MYQPENYFSAGILLLTLLCEPDCQTDQVRNKKAGDLQMSAHGIDSFMISNDNAGCLGMHLHLTHFWVDYWDWFWFVANWDVAVFGNTVNVTCGVHSSMTSFAECLEMFVFIKNFEISETCCRRKIIFPCCLVLTQRFPPQAVFNFEIKQISPSRYVCLQISPGSPQI